MKAPVYNETNRYKSSGGIFINSQQRVLEITKRLLLGNRLTKQELMEEYGKSASVIQRDISYINEILSDGLAYPLELMSNGQNKGQYFLNQPYFTSTLKQLTDIEVFSIASVLSASRAFEDKEFRTLFDKVISLSTEKEKLKHHFGNETVEYKGVPKTKIFDTIAFILDAIENKEGIEFTYTKNHQTRTYQRTPFQLFFSDLYFYVATDNHLTEDDVDYQVINKFRVSSMENVKLIPKNKTLDYHSRFKTGELRKSTWLPFYGKEVTLIIDFFFDPMYVLDRFPNTTIIKQTEDCTRLSLKVNDGWGTKMWLLSQGIHVKVISPKYLADFMVTSLKDTLARYDNK